MKPVITEMEVQGKKIEESVIVYEFASISDFVSYIDSQPVAPWFQGKELSSETTCSESSYTYKNFYMTKDFPEAENLMVHGWESGAREMELKLKQFKTSDAVKVLDKIERKNDFVGFAPVVPLALQGIPNSMINNVRCYKNQKVINIEKMMDYPYYLSAEDIMRESVEALGFVKTLESQGYRCNLFVSQVCASDHFWKCSDREKRVIVKVCVKRSSERLNLAKMAFPLAHPSFLRRYMFKFVERCPHLDETFTRGYGMAIKYDEYVDVLARVSKVNASLGAKIKKTLVMPNCRMDWDAARKDFNDAAERGESDLHDVFKRRVS